MNRELKKAIINHIFENHTEFQLTNRTVEKFTPYIYDGGGGYLIGGEEVYEFIGDAIDLINTK